MAFCRVTAAWDITNSISFSSTAGPPSDPLASAPPVASSSSLSSAIGATLPVPLAPVKVSPAPRAA